MGSAVLRPGTDLPRAETSISVIEATRFSISLPIPVGSEQPLLPAGDVLVIYPSFIYRAIPCPADARLEQPAPVQDQEGQNRRGEHAEDDPPETEMTLEPGHAADIDAE